MSPVNPSLIAAMLALLYETGCSTARYATRATAGSVTDTPDLTAVVVRVPTPWYAPRFFVRCKFKDALGEYEAKEAIVAKYFTIAEDRRFGGLYVWGSREAAERHFDAAWRADVRNRRGAEPDVVILRAPLVIDGPAVPLGSPVGQRSLEYPGTATFVRWEVSGAEMSPQPARTVAASLTHEAGLARAFVVLDAHSVGAIALWVTADDADRATSDGRLRAIGSQLDSGKVEVVRFEAPLLIDASLRHAAESASPAGR
jgi:hypothetical protein